MADINTVVPKVVDALNEALDVAGQPHPYDTITALQAQLTTLQASVAALQASVSSLQVKITNAKAALA